MYVGDPRDRVKRNETSPLQIYAGVYNAVVFLLPPYPINGKTNASKRKGGCFIQRFND